MCDSGGTVTVTKAEGNNGGSNNGEPTGDVSSVTVDGTSSYYCGTYNKTDSAASGKNAVYQNSVRSNLTIKYDGCWVIVDTDDPDNWAFHATVDADNPWEVPKGSWRDSTSFVNDFIITQTGGSNGNGNSSESVKLVVSGFSAEESFYAGVTDMNGIYVLLDATATGKARVWKHPSESIYVKYSDTHEIWTIASETLNVGQNFTEETGTSNPYNEDGSSLHWMLGPGRSGGTVTKE